MSGEGYYRNAFDCEAARRLLLDPADATADGLVTLGIDLSRPERGTDEEDEAHLASEMLYMNEVDPRSFVEVIVDNTDFDRPRLVRPAP